MAWVVILSEEERKYFSIDERCIYINGEPCKQKLKGLPFYVFKYLAECSPHFRTCDQIFDHVWVEVLGKDRPIDDASIRDKISIIRNYLGDITEPYKYIETADKAYRSTKKAVLLEEGNCTFTDKTEHNQKISFDDDTKKSSVVCTNEKTLDVRPATFTDLLKLGYTSLDIAQALVQNDLKLYGKRFNGDIGIAEENEGDAAQWAEYLSSFPDSFKYILNSNNQIVGNFSFLSISSEQEAAFKEGKLSESLFNPAETKDLFSAGKDHILFLLNLSLNEEYSTPSNNALLREMFLSQILLFAEEDIFFKKIIVNVFKASHEAFYKQWGFTFVDNHKNSGRIYELEMLPYPEKLYNQLNKNHHLKEVNEKLKNIYGK